MKDVRKETRLIKTLWLLDFKCSTKLPVSRLMFFFSRWWNLPGHFQRLFAYGLKQPREAETPQRRPQNLTSRCLHLIVTHLYTFHSFKPTYFHTHTRKRFSSRACRHTLSPWLPATCSVTAQLVLTSEGTNAPNSEFFLWARQCRTIVSKWKHWNRFMSPAWGVLMSPRGRHHHSANICWLKPVSLFFLSNWKGLFSCSSAFFYWLVTWKKVIKFVRCGHKCCKKKNSCVVVFQTRSIH